MIDLSRLHQQDRARLIPLLRGGKLKKTEPKDPEQAYLWRILTQTLFAENKYITDLGSRMPLMVKQEVKAELDQVASRCLDTVSYFDKRGMLRRIQLGIAKE